MEFERSVCVLLQLSAQGFGLPFCTVPCLWTHRGRTVVPLAPPAPPAPRWLAEDTSLLSGELTCFKPQSCNNLKCLCWQVSLFVLDELSSCFQSPTWVWPLVPGS